MGSWTWVAGALTGAEGEHGEHAESHGAEAHGGAHHGEVDKFQLGSTIVNFILFVVIIYLAAKKQVLQGLVSRREAMAVQLREAKAKQEEADKRLAEYAHKLDHLEEEVSRIVQSFEAQGQADKERMKEEADKAIDRLVREVDFTIRQETLKAQKEIRESAVSTTLSLAENLVRERITDSDRRRLADDYIVHVEKNGAS